MVSTALSFNFFFEITFKFQMISPDLKHGAYRLRWAWIMGLEILSWKARARPSPAGQTLVVIREAWKTRKYFVFFLQT